MPFDPEKADFTGLGINHYVSHIVHKAVVEVNEKGTEAAAATSVIMVGCALGKQEPPIDFICDRPFIFLIHDRRNVLFMGKLNNPNI